MKRIAGIVCRLLIDRGAKVRFEAPGPGGGQEALKFLIHFVEDLHQPLHVGDTGSRDGNRIQFRFFDLGSNPHRVWDSQVIEWHS